MLRLRIVSDQRRSLAERSSAVFSVEGGTIGRSADNDWVLPDPPRYVSAHHARVQFREGHFYLQDVSTNGVYVNDDMEPLAKRGSSGYRLANGDVLRMGDYHIVAALEARKKPEDDRVPAVPTSIHALRPLRRIGGARHRRPAQPRRAAACRSSTSDPVLPVSAYGQAVNSGRVQALVARPELLAGAPRRVRPPRQRRALARQHHLRVDLPAHGAAGGGGRPRTEERRAQRRWRSRTCAPGWRPSAAGPASPRTACRRMRRGACCIWPAACCVRPSWD